jgi:hypothetical protein
MRLDAEKAATGDDGCHSRRGARLYRVVAFTVNGGCLGRSGQLR